MAEATEVDVDEIPHFDLDTNAKKMNDSIPSTCRICFFGIFSFLTVNY
jgi:hypothetical protein